MIESGNKSLGKISGMSRTINRYLKLDDEYTVSTFIDLYQNPQRKETLSSHIDSISNSLSFHSIGTRKSLEEVKNSDGSVTVTRIDSHGRNKHIGADIGMGTCSVQLFYNF